MDDSPQNTRTAEASKRVRNVATLKLAEPMLEGEFNKRLPIRIICECPDYACTELTTVPYKIFAKVKNKRDVFIVLPEHEYENQHKVLEQEPGYLVVQEYRQNNPPAKFKLLK